MNSYDADGAFYDLHHNSRDLTQKLLQLLFSMNKYFTDVPLKDKTYDITCEINGFFNSVTFSPDIMTVIKNRYRNFKWVSITSWSDIILRLHGFISWMRYWWVFFSRVWNIHGWNNLPVMPNGYILHTMIMQQKIIYQSRIWQKQHLWSLVKRSNHIVYTIAFM